MGRVKRTNKSCHTHKPLSYIIDHFQMQPQQKQHTTATHYCKTLLHTDATHHYFHTIVICSHPIIFICSHSRSSSNLFIWESHTHGWVMSHICMRALHIPQVARLSACNILLQHTTATNYCNKPPQHTTATHYCNTLLQYTIATHYCNTLLQHTTATHCCITSPSACEPWTISQQLSTHYLQRTYCNKLLEHTYFNTLLQHTTATHHRNKLLQHTTASHHHLQAGPAPHPKSRGTHYLRTPILFLQHCPIH